MATGDCVQFKVSMSRGGQPTEIRRFTVDKDVVTNYSYLRQKLYTLFPALQSTGMTVSWKDSDDDMVTIGSDEELIIALTEMEGDCKKIFVNVSTSAIPTVFAQVPAGSTGSAPASPNPTAVHFGVVCDGCDSPVVGYRYKCLSCMDFDLCFDCEHKGVHFSHVMVRYPFPIKDSDYYWKKMSKLQRRLHFAKDSHIGSDHHGKRNSAKRPCTGESRCPAMSSEDVAEAVEDLLATLRSVEEVTPEMIQLIINGLASMDLSQTNKQQNQEGAGEKEGRAGKRKSRCAFMDDSAANRSGRAGAKSAGANAESDGSAPTDPWGPHRHPLSGHHLGSLISNVMQAAPHIVPNILSALNQMSGGIPGMPPSPSAPTTPAQPAAPSASTSAADASSSGAAAGATAVNTPAATAPADAEPMVINLDDDSQPPADQTNESGPSQIGQTPPNPLPGPAPGPSGEPASEDKAPETIPVGAIFGQHVDRQLQTMLNMGFNNEGGWLRDLLVAKEGDITRVLDHLGSAASRTGNGSSLARLELD